MILHGLPLSQGTSYIKISYRMSFHVSSPMLVQFTVQWSTWTLWLCVQATLRHNTSRTFTSTRSHHAWHNLWVSIQRNYYNTIIFAASIGYIDEGLVPTVRHTQCQLILPEDSSYIRCWHCAAYRYALTLHSRRFKQPISSPNTSSSHINYR